MHQTGKSYIYETDGIGKRMPVVFGCFTVSALGLMGVPGLAGFISKWNLTEAAVASKMPLAYGGIVCLLISALLTAIYMMNIVIRAFFPKRDFDTESVEAVKDPSWKMCLPLIVCALCTWWLGLFSEPLIQFFTSISQGIY